MKQSLESSVPVEGRYVSADHRYGVVILNNKVFNMGSEDVNGIVQYY